VEEPPGVEVGTLFRVVGRVGVEARTLFHESRRLFVESRRLFLETRTPGGSSVPPGLESRTRAPTSYDVLRTRKEREGAAGEEDRHSRNGKAEPREASSKLVRGSEISSPAPFRSLRGKTTLYP
jgi:hypothetical protein